MATFTDDSEIKQRLAEEISKAGLTPPAVSDIIADNEWHKFKGLPKKLGKSSSYSLTILPDGTYVGCFKDYRLGDQIFPFCSKATSSFTPEQKKAFAIALEEARKKAAEEEALKHAKVAKISVKEWEAGKTDFGTHYYLTTKKVTAYGLRVNQAGNLMSPIFVEGKLMSLQLIAPEGKSFFCGNKMNMKGGKTHGGYYLIEGKDGGDDSKLIFVEGLATGLTCSEAWGYQVVVCYSANQIENVVRYFRSLYPDKPFIIAGDNDWETKKPIDNPGVHYAKKAAKKYDCKVVFPEFRTFVSGYKDFNDLAALEGIEAVKKHLKRAKKTKALKEDKKKKAATSEITPESMASEGGNVCFWEYDSEGKIRILHAALYDHLKNKGIQKIHIGGKSELKRILAQCVDNVVSEIDLPYIRQMIAAEIKEIPDIRELYTKDVGRLITEERIDTIEFIRPEFVRDTPSESFFFFKNGFVSVSGDDTELHPYSELDKCIWKSKIVDHDIEIDESQADESEFSQFIRNICTEKADPEKNKLEKFDADRHLSLQCVIGFLLHTYKTSATNKAIIFAEVNPDDEPQGRTGKGMIVQAIRKLRKVSPPIDGNKFSADKQFAYQVLTPDMDVMFIDEAQKDFKMQGVYSVVTEGLSIEKKNKDIIYLPIEDTPKIIVNTNYSIPDTSDSGMGRRFEMEISRYYNKKFSPLDHFGHQLFVDWDSTEWNRFYNFMLRCSKLFLKHGKIPSYKTDTLEAKRLITASSRDFVDYMEDLMGSSDQKFKIHSSKLYRDFILYSGQDPRDKYLPSANTVGRWLTAYCKSKGISFERKSVNDTIYVSDPENPGQRKSEYATFKAYFFEKPLSN